MLQALQKFLDNADKDVIYISFGSVASNVSRKITNEIKKVVEKYSNKLFVWKIDLTDWVPPSNVFVGKWMPQKAVICESCFMEFECVGVMICFDFKDMHFYQVNLQLLICFCLNQ